MDIDLYMACSAGNADKVRKIIHSKGEELLISEVNSILGRTIYKGHLEVLQCFTESKTIDVSTLDLTGFLAKADHYNQIHIEEHLIDKILYVIQSKNALPDPKINQVLSILLKQGRLDDMRSIIEVSDEHLLDLMTLLREACEHGMFDATTYLLGLPRIGEHDVNLVIKTNSDWKNHVPLNGKVAEILSVIDSTKQKHLWKAAHEGDLETAKSIVESKDYFDLYPSLYVAASSDHVETFIYLFGKSDLRNDQHRTIRSASGPETRMWINNYYLRLKLGSDLEEKEQATRKKI